MLPRVAGTGTAPGVEGNDLPGLVLASHRKRHSHLQGPLRRLRSLHSEYEASNHGRRQVPSGGRQYE